MDIFISNDTHVMPQNKRTVSIHKYNECIFKGKLTKTLSSNFFPICIGLICTTHGNTCEQFYNKIHNSTVFMI